MNHLNRFVIGHAGEVTIVLSGICLCVSLCREKLISYRQEINVMWYECTCELYMWLGLVTFDLDL